MIILLSLPVLLMSIVIHEVAHAWQARREGDDTAERLGRITLNPAKHVELVGSFLVPAMLFIAGSSILFGWAKPVPVDPRNYRHPKAGDIRVSLAGVVSNLMLAVLFTLVAAAAIGFSGGAFPYWGHQVLRYGIAINLLLAFFNLIPIPPLDGSHVLYQLLPPGGAAVYRRIAPFGFVAVLALVFLFRDFYNLLLTPVDYLMHAADWFIHLWT